MSAHATIAEPDVHRRRQPEQPTPPEPTLPVARLAHRWIMAALTPAGGKGMMARALDRLTPRDRDILIARRLLDDPVPLADLAARHAITPDQVRRIELTAFAAVQQWMQQYVEQRRAACRLRA